MRDTVEKILHTEADRLLNKAKIDGLTQTDLAFLDKLILTHKNFIGESATPQETSPEQQDTAALLLNLSLGPTSVSQTSK